MNINTSKDPASTVLDWILPEGILDLFTISKAVEEHESFVIYLEEKLQKLDIPGITVESKGFHEEKTLQDFPIRDRKATLKIKRRRYRNKETKEEILQPLTLSATGTSYTQEFGDFLKALDREGGDIGSTARKVFLRRWEAADDTVQKPSQ